MCQREMSLEEWVMRLVEPHRAITEYKELRAKLDAAEKDTARLDWLDRNGDRLADALMTRWIEQNIDIRAAIDKAKDTGQEVIRDPNYNNHLNWTCQDCGSKGPFFVKERVYTGGFKRWLRCKCGSDTVENMGPE